MVVVSEPLTRRQRLAELLAAGPWTFGDLRAELAVPTHVLVEDLAHLARSVRARARRGGARLAIEPARCLGCGHVFRERARFTTPSRCPRCRSESVRQAELTLIAAAGG